MKDPAEWEETDLVELIKTEAEENINREFKRADAIEDLTEGRKAEISKDVSAFANRAGGIIIYGIEEESSEPHQARALSPVDAARCSKDRLEQVISSRIKPPIPGLLIRPISLRSASPGRYAYVIKVPQSITVHQASDKRYYRRANFGNQIMDDDEIRQAMNRQVKPTYRVQLQTRDMGKDEIWVSGTVQNTSAMVGRDVSAVLLIPEELSRSGTPFGTDVIEEISCARILSTVRGRIKSQLSPFETMEIIFENAVKIPNPIPSLRFPALVRVYDQFGQAHEAEFCISLNSDPPGCIVSERQRSREVF